MNYVSRYKDAFSVLRRQLVATLIGDWERVDALSAETSVANEVFDLIEPFALVDKYDAYQALDDAWSVIAADLEMLQAEGFDAARKVDPEYVLKKKGGKDVEVQTVGRVTSCHLPLYRMSFWATRPRSCAICKMS